MTIIQLQTFMTIIELGSFSAAANALGYAQSTVTTQIKQLEEELNCLLFERLGKSIIPTQEGERLLVYANKILQLTSEIQHNVPSQVEPSGVLKLGVSESLCYNAFPTQVLEFKRRFTKVDLQISFIEHSTFPTQLKKGDLDIVYTLNPLIESPELMLLYKKPESLGFYASPMHAISAHDHISEKDLDHIPLLLTSHGCNFRAMLLDNLSQAGITPNVILQTSSKTVLKQFAINTLGVAFIPDMIINNEVTDGLLKKLPWSGCDFPIYSQIFVHKDKYINTAMQGLLNILAQ